MTRLRFGYSESVREHQASQAQMDSKIQLREIIRVNSRDSRAEKSSQNASNLAYSSANSVLQKATKEAKLRSIF
jgi:hypothetical protein